MPVFNFVYAERKLHPKLPQRIQEWYLFIDTQETFDAFLKHRSGMLVNIYSRQKKQDPAKRGIFNHMGIGDEYVINMLMEGHLDRKTIVNDCVFLDSLLVGYMSLFETFGKLAIGSNMGCFPPRDDFKILKREPRSVLVFPNDSDVISVTQWPNGFHWYARVGNYDIPGKFDTYESGRRKAIAYLKRKI